MVSMISPPSEHLVGCRLLALLARTGVFDLCQKICSWLVRQQNYFAVCARGVFHFHSRYRSEYLGG